MIDKNHIKKKSAAKEVTTSNSVYVTSEEDLHYRLTSKHNAKAISWGLS